MARTSRWDRPPGPKDFRWGVRLFGKVLICTGLLMFGFVAYQLWGTGIEYARAQNRLDGRFEELMEANGVDPDFNPLELAALSTTAAPTTGVPTTAAPTTVAESVITASSGEPTTTAVAETTTLAPTTLAPTTSIAELPQVLDWTYVEEEQFVGQLWIPRIGIEGQNVVQGTEPTDLQDGPGHYPGTPFPGELGNAAIAGHRTTWGQPFHDLPDVQIGDPIAFLLPDGRVYTYRMTGSETVGPRDGHVVATTDPTRATLTLTTCTPIGTAKQRYILYAEFVPEQSSPVGAYVPRNGDGVSVLPGQNDGDAAPAATTIAALDTASAASEPVATTEPAASDTTGGFVDDPVVSTVPETTPATGEAPATDPPETVAADADAGAESDDDTGLGAASDDSEDAFSSHWFDDKAAFPQVAMWAAVAIAVVVGAYLLARRFKNSWIGLGIGVVPFLVTLYFFYQNVNRLLPAAL